MTNDLHTGYKGQFKEAEWKHSVIFRQFHQSGKSDFLANPRSPGGEHRVHLLVIHFSKKQQALISEVPLSLVNK